MEIQGSKGYNNISNIDLSILYKSLSEVMDMGLDALHTYEDLVLILHSCYTEIAYLIDREDKSDIPSKMMLIINRYGYIIVSSIAICLIEFYHLSTDDSRTVEQLIKYNKMNEGFILSAPSYPYVNTDNPRYMNQMCDLFQGNSWESNRNKLQTLAVYLKNYYMINMTSIDKELYWLNLNNDN